ncbi:MAG: hypothetical protein GX601_01990, partial [Anaerolineales bacterium]|nr:hypothetical protein [Anaerolineales bacterium]
MQPEVELSTSGVARRERVLLAIAAAFVAAAASTLALAGLSFTPTRAGLVVGAWLVVFGALHVAFNHWLPGRDPFLLPVAALLAGWGLVLIGRLAPGFLMRQVIWLAISGVALAALVRFRGDLRWLRRFRYTWLFGGLLVLAVTLIFGVNPSGYGPRLWLSAFG